jgi:hypothetical protein
MEKSPLDKQDILRLEKDLELCERYLKECDIALNAGVPLGDLKERFLKAQTACSALLKHYATKVVSE